MKNCWEKKSQEKDKKIHLSSSCASRRKQKLSKKKDRKKRGSPTTIDKDDVPAINCSNTENTVGDAWQNAGKL